MTQPHRMTWPSLATPWLGLAGLAVIVAAVFIAKLTLGTVWIAPSAVVGALLGFGDHITSSIVNGFRLPRGLTAMVAGAAIAVSGLQMQALLRNPLAGPWMLGVVASARFGVAMLLTIGPLLGLRLATTLGPLASSAMAISAILGATIGMAAVAWLARRVSAITLLLIGVLWMYVADSAARLLMAMTPLSQKSIFISWNDGTFDRLTWPQLEVFLVVVVLALVALVRLIKLLDAMILGDRYAASLGHELRRGRALAILLIVALAGTVTAFCGAIAFLDVAAPHLARSLFRTTSHKTLLPATALTGAVLALGADLATSLPAAQSILHVNHSTAILGGPVLLWMLLRHRDGRQMQFG